MIIIDSITEVKYEIIERCIKEIGMVFIGMLVFICIPALIFNDVLYPIIFGVMYIVVLYMVIKTYIDLNKEMNNRIKLKQLIKTGENLEVNLIKKNNESKFIIRVRNTDEVLVINDYELLPINVLKADDIDKNIIQIWDNLEATIYLSVN